MGHRLSKIYTRTGDTGDTGRADGSRVPKFDPAIDAAGEIDELNSQIGLVLSEPLPAEITTLLESIQHDLFDLGGALSLPGRIALSPRHIEALEQALDALNEDLSPLKEFILPGGTRTAALVHVARAVCRRAERSVCVLAEREKVDTHNLQYLNRLSDLLFVLARALNHSAGAPDVLWDPGKRLKSD